MQRITEIFDTKEKTISFELFPPKTDKGFENLKKTVAQLAELKPDFISCTYGAGGGSRDKTLDIVEMIEKEHNTIALAHLTCVLNTKDQIKAIVEDIQSRGVKNILALRGDPPADNPDWQPGEDNFHYSSELCEFIRKEFGDEFALGVAGFPEGHLLCPDRDKDAEYLKLKIDNGADFVITQLFFDNQDYFEYTQRLKNLGITNRIIPGVLPITDWNALVRFTGLCGATITQELEDIFKPLADDKEATYKAGVEFAVNQAQQLLDAGAPGIHFYSLNKLQPTKDILEQLTL